MRPGLACHRLRGGFLSASYGFAGFNGRTLADNAPEAMLSLVTGMAVQSGLTPAVAARQRSAQFTYLMPA